MHAWSLQVPSSRFGETVDKSELVSHCGSVTDGDVQKFPKTICRAPQALGLWWPNPALSYTEWVEGRMPGVCSGAGMLYGLSSAGQDSWLWPLYFTWLWHSLGFCLHVLHGLHLNYSSVQQWDVLQLLPGCSLALFTPGSACTVHCLWVECSPVFLGFLLEVKAALLLWNQFFMTINTVFLELTNLLLCDE